MSAEPTHTAPTAEVSDQEIRDALVSLYSLSNEAVESIHELTRSLQLRFADAALHTGLVTPDQLADAIDWVRRRAVPQSGGIIEEVLRRQVSQRRGRWEGVLGPVVEEV